MSITCAAANQIADPRRLRNAVGTPEEGTGVDQHGVCGLADRASTCGFRDEEAVMKGGWFYQAVTDAVSRLPHYYDQMASGTGEWCFVLDSDHSVNIVQNVPGKRHVLGVYCSQIHIILSFL